MEKVQSNANSKKKEPKRGKESSDGCGRKEKGCKLVISHLKKKIAKEFPVLSLSVNGLKRWKNYWKKKNLSWRSTCV